MISGVYKPTDGEILLNGMKTNGLPPYRMAALGVGRTFQVVKPFSGLSVLDNVIVALGMMKYGSFRLSWKFWNTEESRLRATDILRRVGLADKALIKAALLPLGNLRKLEIARALALEPKLLLLDECFSGLRHEEIKATEELIMGRGDGAVRPNSGARPRTQTRGGPARRDKRRSGRNRGISWKGGLRRCC